jgi:ATP-binding cassette, subfamily B, bacterial MsbA
MDNTNPSQVHSSANNKVLSEEEEEEEEDEIVASEQKPKKHEFRTAHKDEFEEVEDDADVAINRSNVWKLFRLALPYKWQLGLAFLGMLGEILATLVFPIMLGFLLDTVFVARKFDLFFGSVVVLLVTFVVQIGSAYLQNYFSELIAERIVVDLRGKLYAHLQDLPLSFFHTQRTGDLLSRLTNDIAQVQTIATTNFIWFCRASLTIVGSVLAIVIYDWRMLALIAMGGLFILVVSQRFGQRFECISEQVANELGQATTVAEETLANQRTVKLFGRQSYEVGRYNHHLSQIFSLTRRRVRLESLYNIVVESNVWLLRLVVIIFGGYLVLQGELSPGTLITILVFLENLTWPFEVIAEFYTEIRKALGAANRVFTLLDTSNTLPDIAGAYTLPFIKGHLRFEQVEFSYQPTQRVLDGVTFEAQPGQIVALVGPSGAGKTTLASLVGRLYEVSGGRIMLDGHDIRQVTQASLRRQLAVVPQEPVLFGLSVRENIAYGRLDATREEIIAAAQAANAHDFIEKLPQGYDTLVGENGFRLSGGQRQRIAIARAIVRQPRLLILDEATSSLDNESEQLVQSALDHLMTNCTTLVIAHRLTTVEKADHIVVLEAGRIVESGKHDQLLYQKGLYYRLYTRNFED